MRRGGPFSNGPPLPASTATWRAAGTGGRAPPAGSRQSPAPGIRVDDALTDGRAGAACGPPAIAYKIVGNLDGVGYRAAMATAPQETAERALRVAISRGDMPPGYRLVEAEMVALTGVSRSAVRLAIDALIAEGLVERIPNRGARVRIVSTEEAVAITEVRLPLEGLLARKAAERITDAEIDRLRVHLETMTAAVDSGDVLKYSALIQQLHGMVAEAARHPVAADLVGRLQAQLVRHQFRLSLRPGRPRVSLGQLADLVEAITARDPERAESAAHSHFRSVIAALSEPAQDSGVPA
jgi:DNA-binding GntR family transcriptional regulator